jgi:hypothetical protein
MVLKSPCGDFLGEDFMAAILVHFPLLYQDT